MRRNQLALVIAAAGAGLLLLGVSTVAHRGFSRASPMAQTDEGEPNDTIGDATVLCVPDTVTGWAENQPITATDHFQVPTTIGSHYRATLNIGGAGILLLRMHLYNTGQQYVTSSSSSSSSTELSWTAAYTTYYIEIRPSGPATSTLLLASYVLDLYQVAPPPTPTPTATPTPIHQKEEDEPNDQFDDANLVVASSSVIGAIVRPPEDRECFVMHTAAGSWYTASLAIESPEGMELRMDLYDEDRAYVKSSPVSSTATSLAWAATASYHYVCIEAPTSASTTQSAFYRLDLQVDAFEGGYPVYLPVVAREAWLGISLTGLLGFVIGNRIRRS